MIVLDFETHPILNGGAPAPVGVAIRTFGERARGTYYHWGHRPNGGLPSASDRAWTRDVRGTAYVAESDAKALVARILRDETVLYFNAGFDVRVASTWLGLDRYPPPERIHDAAWLAFLHDPNAPSLSLKPLCERLLGDPPTTQDRLKEWVQANVKQTATQKAAGLPGVKGASWGAYIAYAPARLVGPYALDDVVKTEKLFRYLLPRIEKWGMSAAYERERRVAPVLWRMQDRGFGVNEGALARAHDALTTQIGVVDEWLAKPTRLGQINLGSPNQVREQLLKNDLMDEDRWDRYRTKTGALQTGAHVLQRCMKDRKLANVLAWRGKAEFMLSTFVLKWLGQTRVHPIWNQTRMHGGAAGIGARTGRISSTPNVQNISSAPPTVVTRQGDEGLLVPPCFADLSLPHLRRAIVPARDHAFIDVDYSQQELRILAHYEGGELMKAYRENPRLDLHTFVQQTVNQRTAKNWARKPIKNVNFGIIYGSGAAKQADQLGLDPGDEMVIRSMRELKSDVLTALPGVNALDREFKYETLHHVTPEMMEAGGVLHTEWSSNPRVLDPIYTIGGRICFLEPPYYDADEDREMSFEYKILNTAIQGSAADQIKEAMIELDVAGYNMVLSVHDELVFEQEGDDAELAAKACEIQSIMEGVTERLRRPSKHGEISFGVPMVAEPEIKLRSWGE